MKYGYLKRCLCISIAAAVVLGSGPTMLLAEDLLTSGYETDGSLGGDSILSDGTGGSSNGDIVLGSSTEGGGTQQGGSTEGSGTQQSGSTEGGGTQEGGSTEGGGTQQGGDNGDKTDDGDDDGDGDKTDDDDDDDGDDDGENPKLSPTPVPSDPTVTPEAADPTVTPELTDPTVTPEVTDPTVTPEAADPTVTPEVIDPTVTPEVVDPSVTPEAVDPTVTPELTDPTVTPEVTDPTVTPEPTLTPETAETEEPVLESDPADNPDEENPDDLEEEGESDLDDDSDDSELETDDEDPEPAEAPEEEPEEEPEENETVNDIISRIEALIGVTITLDDKDEIAAIRELYDSLTDEEREQIGNYALFLELEELLGTLEEEEDGEGEGELEVDDIDTIAVTGSPVYYTNMVSNLHAGKDFYLNSLKDNYQLSFSDDFASVMDDIEAEYKAKNHLADRSDVDDLLTTTSGDTLLVRNWQDILAIYVYEQSKKGDTEFTLDADSKDKLAEIFADMNPVVKSKVNPTRDAYGDRHINYYIKKNNIDKDDREILKKYVETDCKLLCAVVTAAKGFVRESVGEDVSEERVNVIAAAYSLVGKVGYFWGGKSVELGEDPSWGSAELVTAEGSNSTGTTRAYGLDCSGFVTWAVVNGFQDKAMQDDIGDGTSEQWLNANVVSEADAQPGDLVFQRGPEAGQNNHVGILVGQTDAGDWIAVHCSSGKNGVTVGEAYGASFRYIRQPDFYPTEDEIEDMLSEELTDSSSNDDISVTVDSSMDQASFDEDDFVSGAFYDDDDSYGAPYDGDLSNDTAGGSEALTDDSTVEYFGPLTDDSTVEYFGPLTDDNSVKYDEPLTGDSTDGVFEPETLVDDSVVEFF